MSDADKENEIPVKVVDRRWWANTDASRGTADAVVQLAQADLRRGARAAACREGQADPGVPDEVPPGVVRVRGDRGCGCAARSRRTSSAPARSDLASCSRSLDNLDRAIDAARNRRRPTRCFRASTWCAASSSAKLEGIGVKPIESDGAPIRSIAARSHHDCAGGVRRSGRHRSSASSGRAIASAMTCSGRRLSPSRNPRSALRVSILALIPRSDRPRQLAAQGSRSPELHSRQGAARSRQGPRDPRAGLHRGATRAHATPPRRRQGQPRGR